MGEKRRPAASESAPGDREPVHGPEACAPVCPSAPSEEESVHRPEACAPMCPHFHDAVELVGRRWTGVILRALMNGPRRFSEVAAAIPELSDRLLSERMKELEARGLVTREVLPGRPPRVRYALSAMGRDLEPALDELGRWADRWLAPPGAPSTSGAGAGARADGPGSRPVTSPRR